MSSSPIVAPMSWQPELELFEDWLRAAGLPPSTRRIRLYHVRRFAAVTGLDPYAVGLADLIGFIASHEWAANTRASHRASFRAFYRWAVDAGRVEVSPAEKMPTVQAPLGRPRPASEASVQHALEDADVRVRLMVRLGATVGLRCGEIAQAPPHNLIRETAGYSLRVLGKGSKVRIVPIADELAGEIMTAHGFAFPGQIDGHISAGYVSKLVSRTLPPGVTAHMLRHRFASRAFAGSLNIRAVQELLGHASVATTQIYTAVDDTELRRAATAAA